jgi:hypothetical protein
MWLFLPETNPNLTEHRNLLQLDDRAPSLTKATVVNRADSAGAAAAPTESLLGLLRTPIVAKCIVWCLVLRVQIRVLDNAPLGYRISVSVSATA